ncbi:hypothetical protein BDP81DRAFT_388853 [Colletotrichum phormii]|uniref:Uncharacterized protein n=1 Tax=Colletotrichum phormii TaxID=359342 RepID=A0AAJ0EP12_9PEZI|nr:uncharacterized protein BDP81DRAFT_388853 [Colletotrichum phormii]KAK1655998.1 hypothetical protein BDP81DRAFT_388853 [Colletotrichum phormii]
MAYMQELKAIRLSYIGTEALGAVGQIYEYLSKNCHKLKGDANDKLRSVMDFVYHPQGGWVPLDACIWQGSSYLPNSLALANVYPACAELFRRRLGVSDVGVAEIVKELVRVDNIPDSSRDHPLLKTTILALSESRGKGQPSPVKLNDDLRGKMRDLKIFPMASTAESSGEAPSVVYRSIDKDWYIGDRSVLRRAFVGKVDILNFDIGDIDKLMPLIKWLSLDNKLLSAAVQQRTVNVGSPVYNRGWSNDIRKRARYIALLGTDTDVKLPQFEVSLASGLSVERTIGDIRGETEVGHVSITESNDSVKIVVLKDPFKNSSPRFDRELVDFFIRRCAIEDVSRVSLVSLVLRASFGDVRDLLEGANIRESIEDLDFRVDEAEEHAAAETGGMAGVNAVARGPNAELGLGVLRSQAYATDHSPRIYTSAQRDLSSRFKEIGLKAEIHVNEYFKQHLLDWKPEKNWTSHLREEKGHPLFLGDESTTADFTYTDMEGRMLEALGVVRKSWFSHTITYHIEVKGTVCELEEPFHFSQNQMNLARNYAFKHGKIPTDVFLIGRVYNVEKKKPDLKFYWNPWEMNNKGRLVMTVSEGYRIAPGNAAATPKAA